MVEMTQLKEESDIRMNGSLISVITVTYNAVSTIEETILSVISQNYPHIEYIIIDGGSTDGTVDVIKKYADEITYWISEPDNGIYEAMNKAVRFVKGDWVYFLGSGDLLLLDAFHKLLSNPCPNCIYYGNVRYIPSNRILDGKFDKFKIIRHNIPHQGILYPVTVFNRYQYDLKYKIFADYVLNWELFSDSHYTFVYKDCIVADYLQGGISAVNRDEYFVHNRNKLVKNKFGLFYYVWYMCFEMSRKLYRFICPLK